MLAAAALLLATPAALASGDESPEAGSEARDAVAKSEGATDPDQNAEEAPPTDFRPTESVPPGSSVSFPVDI